MKILEKIKSEEYLIDLGFQVPAMPMHNIISERSETLLLRESYKNGAISENEIKHFINGLLREFKYGEKFYYDLTLATIAVALENCFTTFSDEYLYELSKIELTEFKTATDIAKVCLMEKEKSPSFSYKVYKSKIEINVSSRIKASFIDPNQSLTSNVSNQYVKT